MDNLTPRENNNNESLENISVDKLERVKDKADDSISQAPPEEKPSITSPGFEIGGMGWRIGAFLIDSFILCIVGSILVAIIKSAQLNFYGWEILIGLAIAVGYFGIFNSSIGNGQTIGKRICKIRVVDKDANCIDIKTSLLRALLLQLPWFWGFSGIPTSGIEIYMVLFLLQTVVSILLGLGIFYFFIANQKTHQGLHDLICKSYVVKADSYGSIIPQPITLTNKIVFGILSIGICLLSMSIFYFLFSIVNKNKEVINKVTTRVESIEPVKAFGFTYSMHYNSSHGSSAMLTVNLLVNKMPSDPRKYADETVKALRDSLNNAKKINSFTITIIKTCNIGLAGSTDSLVYFYPMDDGNIRADKVRAARYESSKFGFFNFGGGVEIDAKTGKDKE